MIIGVDNLYRYGFRLHFHQMKVLFRDVVGRKIIRIPMYDRNQSPVIGGVVRNITPYYRDLISEKNFQSKYLPSYSTGLIQNVNKFSSDDFLNHKKCKKSFQS